MLQQIRTIVDRLQTDLADLKTELNRIEPSTAIVRVSPGDDVNAAIGALATTGGVILARPGDYSTNFTIGERPADAPLITVTSDTENLPVDGGRITREYWPGIARFSAAVTTAPLIKGRNRSRNIAFVGVGFGPQASDRTVVALGGDKTETPTPDDLPSGYTFDRVLWMGDPVKGQHRALQPHASNVVVRGCSVHDYFEVGREAQAICGWNGTRFLTIENSNLEAGAQSILIGGAGSASADMVPQNVQIIGCRLAKDPRWRQFPIVPTVKCLFEAKSVMRLAITGTLFEKVWKQNWSSGVAIALKSSDQNGDAPWSACEQVFIEDCAIRDVGTPFSIVGQSDAGHPSERMKNVLIRNLLAYNMGTTEWTGNGRSIPIVNTPLNLQLDHVTLLSAPGAYWHSVLMFTIDALGSRDGGFSLTNSLLEEGEYGVVGQPGIGMAGLQANYPSGYTFSGNVLRDDFPGRTVMWPNGNPVLSAGNFDAMLDPQMHGWLGALGADGRAPGADPNRLDGALRDLWR